MISTKAVVVVSCIVLSVCRGATIDNVDRVLQNLGLQYSQPQLFGDSINFDEFLGHSAQFKEFVVEFGRDYNSDDEILRRFDIFRDNLKEIDFLQQNELGTATYGVNRFADMTAEEFSFGLSPVNIEDIKSHPALESYKCNNLTLSPPPKKVNYKEKGKVLSKVQDQHMCGSCWAHATVATLETANAIKHNQLIELSKQQVVDCDFLDDGCCGGWPFQAYEWIHHVGGLMEEKDYKQIAYEGKCKFDAKKAKVNIQKYYIIYSSRIKDNVAQQEKFLSEIGTLVTIINANGFRFYRGGIMNQPDVVCGKSTGGLNHAVFNVGYDEEVINGEIYRYWILKNSWGASWGENGYLRVLRGDNVCGMEWIACGAVVV